MLGRKPVAYGIEHPLVPQPDPTFVYTDPARNVAEAVGQQRTGLRLRPQRHGQRPRQRGTDDGRHHPATPGPVRPAGPLKRREPQSGIRRGATGGPGPLRRVKGGTRQRLPPGAAGLHTEHGSAGRLLRHPRDLCAPCQTDVRELNEKKAPFGVSGSYPVVVGGTRP